MNARGWIGAFIGASLWVAAPGAAHSEGSPSGSAGRDARKTFEAGFFLGDAIDTFAASDIDRYLNPESAGGVKQRLVGGFTFEYRLIDAALLKDKRPLWLYGETIHGVRSTAINCQENPTNPLCRPLAGNIAGDRTLYIIRNATSLEGFLGARWEFFHIKDGSDAPASLYFKAQAGFMTVAGKGDDLVDMHHGGFGLIVTSGTFLGSYIEYGLGTNDLIINRKHPRHKIDAHLSWEQVFLDYVGARPFAQITVDTDLGRGTDSVQSYLGFEFDLRNFFSFQKPGKP